MNRFVGTNCTETASGTIIDLADPHPDDIKIADIAWALSRQNRFAGHTIAKKPYSVGQHTVQVSRIAEQALRPGNEFNGMFIRYLEGEVQAWATAEGTEQAEIDFEVARWSGYIEHLRVKLDDSKIQTIAFHALMHDFAEAYLVDLPTPVKRLPGVYAAYRAAEQKMDEVIFKKFELAYADKWPAFREFGEIVVKWADMIALKIEAYHMMPSRGLTWNLPQEQPSLQILNAFRWPIDSEQACGELIARFDELKPDPEYF